MTPFRPILNGTINIGASTSSAGSALAGAPRSGPFQVRVVCTGSTPFFLKFGAATVSATSGDLPFPAPCDEVLTLSNRDDNPITHAAAITASGTATVYLTTGDGI
jgi:hypothetical protein